MGREVPFCVELYMSFSEAQHRLGGQIGGVRRWAKVTDRRAEMQKTWEGFEAAFVRRAREMFPDGDDELITKVAAGLRKEHYARMTLASLKARAAKRAQAPGRGNQGPG